MNFKYFRTADWNADIEINAIGNCAIKGICMNEMYYICIIRTTLGVTELFETGPFTSNGELSNKCSLNYNKIEYDDRKIRKFISSFLQEPRKPLDLNIYQAEEIPIDEALESCIDICNYMRKTQGLI